MDLVGYRFKSHQDETWAYTFDIKGSQKGGGLNYYNYVEPIYVKNENKIMTYTESFNPSTDVFEISIEQLKKYLESKTTFVKFIKKIASNKIYINSWENEDSLLKNILSNQTFYKTSNSFNDLKEKFLEAYLNNGILVLELDEQGASVFFKFTDQPIILN